MSHRLTCLLVLVLLLAACGQTELDTVQRDVSEGGGDATTGDTDADAPAAGEGLEVVTTIYPLAWLVESVAPGAAITEAGSQGQDPHDLELTPSERGLLENADVVAYLGPISFQPQVEQAVETSQAEVVSASDVVGEDRLLSFHGHEHHDHDHDDDHGDHDHDHGDVDPHFWFDLEMMGDVGHAVAEAFTSADPDNADVYRANAEKLDGELTGAARTIDDQLSDCRLDTAVVSHEAYAYLLAPRELHQEGVSDAGGHGGASPQRLADLVDHIRDNDVPMVLAEPVEGRADAEALAEEAGVELGNILSLDIVTDEARGQGLPALVEAQAQAFSEAMDCG